jgi:hypothetical protein
MARNNGRWGRLRRVLSEDLSSTGHACEGASAQYEPGDTPRYGAGANIENHPQVTDYVPRRFHHMATWLGAGAVLGVFAEAIAHRSDLLTGIVPNEDLAELANSVADRLTAWTSTVVLLGAAACAQVVHLLKRHRIDDIRGRYRIWRTASWLALVVSCAAVTGLHRVVSQVLGSLTGWHLLQADAVWWVVPTALAGAWILVRLIRNTAEYRPAAGAFILASGCFAVALAAAAGWTPLANALWSQSLSRSLPLVGYLFCLLGTMLTARYVVLDVQGLIDHPFPPAQPAANSAASRHVTPASSSDIPEDDEVPSTAVAWTDGTHPEEEAAHDRHLSKAERKRLRKQARNHAA